LENNFNVGERLKQIRTERALSQEQVANLAGVTPAYFGQVERGQKRITVHTLGKICFALNMSFGQFFETVGSEPDSNTDDVSAQILHQLNGRSKQEKQAMLRMVKLMLSFKEI
jgi:transcriptional regulator with XRE-family HTH domain